MAFPSIPSIPSFTPSDIQKDALNFLQSGAPKFANPLTDQLSGLSSKLQSPGGLDISGLGSIKGEISALCTNADVIASGFDVASLQAMADDLGSHLGSFNLSGIQGLSSQTFSNLSAKVAEQTSTLVNDMQNVITKTNAYATTKEMFADKAPDGETPTTNICDGIKSICGSMAGAADELMDVAKGAIDGMHDMFNAVSDTVKSGLNTAISTIRSTISDIIASITSGGGTGLLSQLTTMISDVKASVTGFMQEAAAMAGKTIDELKTSIAGLIDDAKAGLEDMTAMIRDELKEFENINQYLKDAAMAMSFPSLSPCAKEVVGKVAGAAGAGPLVSLVS